MKTTIRAALAGNPNCGKSTIFNELTGAKQTVGNFPGVTVERREGATKFDGRTVQIVDLPGVYNLTAYSDEERVAAEYLNVEAPDVVVNIVDASNLERNLYLTFALKELGRPTFVVLNMIDVAQRRGIEIDVDALSQKLGLPVLQAIGNRGVGVKDALEKIIELADASENDAPKSSEPVEKTPQNLESSCAARKHARSGCAACSDCANCSTKLALQTAADVARYQEISRICARCVQRVSDGDEQRFSDRVDALLTNKYLGAPIFLLAMYLVFQLTFTIGQYPMDWIETGFGALADFLSTRLPDGLAKSLLIDGVIGGVGGVLVFLPNIFFLFLAISVLEDSGYMARAALLCDRSMSKIGLHGRSVVPLLVGFGCTVPALMAAKMLSDRRERLATMFALPLFSCGARFPIYALLIPAFFPLAWQGPVLWAIYLIGILLAVVVAKTLSLVFRGAEPAPFMIELPAYHLPTFRTVGIQTLSRCWQYVKKAGTVILGISVVLWFLTTFPGLSAERRAEFENRRAEVVKIETPENVESSLQKIDDAEAQAALEQSFAGRIGRFIEPVLRPAGFDWKIGTALIGAVAAKEIFVAQMGIVYSVGEADETSTELADVLRSRYSPLVGFCVMLFCLIGTPCMATFAAMAKESGSWRWAFAQWAALTALAWIVSVAVYQIGSRIF